MITGDYKVKNMWNDDDFYSEPSEFDEQVDEFKKSLRASVKEEILAEMDRLRKENEKLTDIRDHWDEKVREFENDYASKKRDLEKKLREAETVADNAKRMALFDLIRDYPDHAYTVDKKYIKKPKCDKCDDNRKIPFITPRGKAMTERCECDEPKPVYSVRAIPLVEITCHWNGDPSPRYLCNNDPDDVLIRFASTFFDDTPFEQIDERRKTLLFCSEDRANQYVEWKNQQESSK